MITASAVVYALCMALGPNCAIVPDARVTSYVPQWGGINCMEPCDKTAFMSPVVYGETAACGPSWPWNTHVAIFTPWGQVIERRCQDRGGAITDRHVDIAMTPEEHDRLPLYGYWPVLWFYPPEPPAPRETTISSRRHCHEID